ncbi:hypothetical protein Btru_070465 [Bulinus truncatus]|nr:hypothetical protein Btru_070465 [Bulinus truncatus]
MGTYCNTCGEMGTFTFSLLGRDVELNVTREGSLCHSRRRLFVSQPEKAVSVTAGEVSLCHSRRRRFVSEPEKSACVTAGEGGLCHSRRRRFVLCRVVIKFRFGGYFN